MREHIRFFATICNQHLTLPDPMVEFGSMQVEGQEGYADMRPIFKRHALVGADLRAGLGVDVMMDMSQAALRSESVGTVLSFDTLEHMEYVREAMAEAYRILKDGGLFIVTSVMDFRIHAEPVDYWRFTPQGLQNLLRVFDGSMVSWAGDPDKPHTVVGVGVKGKMQNDPGPFLAALDDWQQRVEV